jgi:hypothetical protein
VVVSLYFPIFERDLDKLLDRTEVNFEFLKANHELERDGEISYVFLLEGGSFY